MEATDSDRPLSGLSPFAIARGIKGLAREPKSMKRLRDGSFLVEVGCKAHSDNLLRSTMLVDRPVKVSVHKSLNTSKGVVRCRELRPCSEEEIKEELASQGVIGVHRVLARKGQDRVPTDTYFLTFCMPSLPETIRMGYLNVKVSLYIPSPLRCFKCQRFGHVRDRCSSQEVCGVCAGDVHEGPCKNPALCVNCGGAHPSSSKDCPVWMKERRIQHVKTEKKISFFEARRMVEASEPRPGTSYAAAAKEKLLCSECRARVIDSGRQDSRIGPSSQRSAGLGGGAVSAIPRPAPLPPGGPGAGHKSPGGTSVPHPSPAGEGSSLSGASAPSPSQDGKGKPTPVRRSTPSSGVQSAKPPPPPKPPGGGSSIGPVGSKKAEIVEKPSPKLPKARTKGPGGPSGHRKSAPVSVSNSFAALISEGEGEDMEQA